MSTTEKRITTRFTHEQFVELTRLSEKLGESPCILIRRAIALLYLIHFPLDIDTKLT